MEDGKMREKDDSWMVETIYNPLEERKQPKAWVGSRVRPSRVQKCVAHAKLIVQWPVEQSECQWLKRRKQDIVSHQAKWVKQSLSTEKVEEGEPQLYSAGWDSMLKYSMIHTV